MNVKKRRGSLSSTRLIRSFNVVSVLQTLYREGGCSRASITEATRMSPATVTRIVAELTKQGVVTEQRVAESTGGRRPVILQLDYDRLYVVGIQLLRDRVALAVSDVRGAIRQRREFTPYSLEPGRLVDELAREAQLLLANAQVGRERILGVGLAISGIVDSERGVLVRSVNLGWREVDVAEALGAALGFRVLVENDANAAALAESWFGCARDASSLIYIKTGTGVGAGVVCEGTLVTGPRGMAGEIGHVPFDQGGHACRCGQRGCLETYLYAYDVTRRFEAETGQHLSELGQLFDMARDGHPVARRLVDEGAGALATAASFAGGLLDLDMVVIGGAWGSLGPEFLQTVRERCQLTLERSGLNKTLDVRGSQLGEDSDLLGAVGLVINRWFTPPI